MLRFLFFISMLLIFVKGEEKWHSSQVALMKLYELQKKHFTIINNYLDLETKRLEELKNFLAEWQDHKLPTEVIYSQNHFNSMNAMTRISTQLRKVECLMNNNISVEALKEIDKHKYISENHIILAIQSLRRQQLFYMIPASEMAAGRFENITIGDPMNSCECYIMLEHFFNNNDIYGILDWAVEVFNKWNNEGHPKCVDIEKLNLFSLTSSMYTGTNSTSLRNLNGLRHPKDVDNLFSYFHLVKNDILISNESRIFKYMDFDPLDRIYTKLCKHGESKRILTKYCKCRYQSRSSHYRKLMPFKEEDIYGESDIKIYHDILYDSEIQKLKIIASKEMEDAMVIGNEETSLTGLLNENYRSCQLSWMKKKTENRLFNSLNDRIESITGLSIGSAERFQTVNYGLGGHFSPHCDAFGTQKTPIIRRIGDRLLTVLFYLTDVEYGGCTVFPVLNIVSPAEKGAALVFYNLHTSNGEINIESIHGACPIIIGNKWITTKWIHEAGQDLPYNWKKNTIKMYQKVFNYNIYSYL